VENFADDTLVQIAPAKNLTAERSTNLRDHFPFAEVRDNQGPALDRLTKWTSSPKKFFLLEGPTGFGKSPVDIAMASFAKTLPSYGAFQQGAYILTPQKSLAEQYMKDFRPNGLVELKGRNNYHCAKWTETCGEEIDCETGAMLNSAQDDRCDNCPYKAAKDQFMFTPFGATNFDYYLHESNHAHQLADRNLLVLDEAHNTEDKILGLTDTTITQRKCDEFGIVSRLPIFGEGDNTAVLMWLDKVFMPAAIAHGNALTKRFKDSRDEERAKIAKKIQAVERFLQRINMFRHSEDPDEWFAYSDWDEKKRGDKGTGDLIIKPLTARLFADKLMFSKAQKVLLTSATILDFRTFMRNLGIADSDAEIMAVDSDFPVENRPIFFNDPVGSMSYKNIDKTLPLMALRVEALLRRYGKHKGIVHTNSYKINRYIVNHLLMTDLADRIITHDNSRGAREMALARHESTTGKPTVLISPSMTEGLDLKED
jgi:Rad3-related DNA helicase